MSGHFDDWITKDEIRQATRLRDSTLNNALTALKKRGIILPRNGVKGSYRLPTKAFAVWIRAYTAPAAEAPAANSQ
jgi:hypothetical protein